MARPFEREREGSFVKTYEGSLANMGVGTCRLLVGFEFVFTARYSQRFWQNASAQTRGSGNVQLPQATI